MSSLPFISHRMFVAAVGTEEHTRPKPARPGRRPVELESEPRHRTQDVFELTPKAFHGLDACVPEAAGIHNA